MVAPLLCLVKTPNSGKVEETLEILIEKPLKLVLQTTERESMENLPQHLFVQLLHGRTDKSMTEVATGTIEGGKHANVPSSPQMRSESKTDVLANESVVEIKDGEDWSGHEPVHKVLLVDLLLRRKRMLPPFATANLCRLVS